MKTVKSKWTIREASEQPHKDGQRSHPSIKAASPVKTLMCDAATVMVFAALLTAALAMTGARDMPSDRPTVVNHGDGQEPTPTIDKPAPLAAHGSAITILPRSDIVLKPVAGSPPVGQARNPARWPVVVRQVTAAALTLTVVGAVAYWQLTVHAGQNALYYLRGSHDCTGISGTHHRMGRPVPHQP